MPSKRLSPPAVPEIVSTCSRLRRNISTLARLAPSIVDDITAVMVDVLARQVKESLKHGPKLQLRRADVRMPHKTGDNLLSRSKAGSERNAKVEGKSRQGHARVQRRVVAFRVQEGTKGKNPKAGDRHRFERSPQGW